MTAPSQVAATLVDTAPVGASAIAAAHAATALVDAAVQLREMDASAVKTAPRQVAATTFDTSAPPLLEAPAVVTADAATAFVNAAVQTREMDATAVTTVPPQVAATTADTLTPPPAANLTNSSHSGVSTFTGHSAAGVGERSRYANLSADAGIIRRCRACGDGSRRLCDSTGLVGHVCAATGGGGDSYYVDPAVSRDLSRRRARGDGSC